MQAHSLTLAHTSSTDSTAAKSLPGSCAAPTPVALRAANDEEGGNTEMLTRESPAVAAAPVVAGAIPNTRTRRVEMPTEAARSCTSAAAKASQSTAEGIVAFSERAATRRASVSARRCSTQGCTLQVWTAAGVAKPAQAAEGSAWRRPVAVAPVQTSVRTCVPLPPHMSLQEPHAISVDQKGVTAAMGGTEQSAPLHPGAQTQVDIAQRPPLAQVTPEQASHVLHERVSIVGGHTAATAPTGYVTTARERVCRPAEHCAEHVDQAVHGPTVQSVASAVMLMESPSRGVLRPERSIRPGMT